VINSVGIDIGTTTSQVIFSSLELVNRAAPTQVPRYEFIDRKILHQSRLFFTPLNEDGAINEKKLTDFILNEYTEAGFKHNEVETGAIIITGETSKAQNAKNTLMKLADSLGDFVVAVAGPHLESIIAGKGSGSAAYSEEKNKLVMNIDIGGGTSNFVVFKNGRVIDTCCVNVGSRLIQIDEKGSVKKVAGPAKQIIRYLFPEYRENYTTLSMNDLKRICEYMSEIIVECISGTTESILSRSLMMTPSLKQKYIPDALFISGGVGECYYNRPEYNNWFKFSDLGLLFADALLLNDNFKKLKILKPKQTIRATVIGAGAYTLSLSGSTIWLGTEKLPIRNLPIIHPCLDWSDANASLSNGITESAQRLDIDLSKDDYAIYLQKDMPVNYKAVQSSADEITKVYRKYRCKDNNPAIVLAYNDIGKVLGMVLEPRLHPRPLAVIDEVQTNEGDYIDIGKSYFGGEIVPLTIKSLAFP